MTCRITHLLAQWDKPIILAVILLTMTLGVGYALILGDALRFPDEQDYYTLAHNLSVAGRYTLDGQVPTAFRPPGYPWLLAGLLELGSPILALRIANMVALCACIGLLAALLRTHVSKRAAVLGACGVLCYPVLLYTANTLYPQTLAACLFLAVLYLILKAGRAVRYIGAGLLMGYLILTVPLFVLTAGTLGAWMLFDRGTHKRHAALFLLVTALVVTPWTLRNYEVFGRFVFVASNSGINLLLGNSPNTTPSSGVNVDVSTYLAAAAHLDEVAQDAYYREQAVAYIRSNPVDAARLYGLKALNYFNYRNELYTSSEASSLRDLVMLLTYGTMLVVAIVRYALVRVYPMTRMERLFLLLYLSNGLFSAIFFTRVRFRLPFDFLLIAVVALFLAHILAAVMRSMPQKDARRAALVPE